MSNHPPSKKAPIGPPTEIGRGKKYYMIAGQKFEVDTQYDLVKILGYGAYGTVVSAVDTASAAPAAVCKDSAAGGGGSGGSSSPPSSSSQRVAIKKISRVFDDLVDGKRILREIKVLGLIRHPNLLALRRILRPLSKASFEDIYVVTDQYDADLHAIIRSPQKLSDEHCQYFMVQAFRGLAFLHSANVMHRDLKPSNLLVNGNCDLVICDFGLARGVDTKSELTDYVVTRWYRPPELLTLSTHYDAAVDVWSLALIFGELLNRRTVVQGKDYITQLALVIDLLGTPSDDELRALSKEARDFILAQPRKTRREFATLFPTATPEGVDLLEKTLRFNPKHRLTALDALRHPYFKNFFDGTEAHTSTKKFTWELDDVDLRAAQLREGLWDEVLRHNPDPAGDSGGGDAAQSRGVGGPDAASAAPAKAAKEPPADKGTAGAGVDGERAVEERKGKGENAKKGEKLEENEKGKEKGVEERGKKVVKGTSAEEKVGTKEKGDAEQKKQEKNEAAPAETVAPERDTPPPPPPPPPPRSPAPTA